MAEVIQDKGGPSGINDAPSTVTLNSAPTPGTGRYLIAAAHSSSADSVIQWATAGFTPFPGTLALDAGRPTEFGYRKIQSGDGVSWSIQAEDPNPAAVADVSEWHIWEVKDLDEAALLHDVALGVAGTYGAGVVAKPGSLDLTATQGGVIFVAVGLGGTTGGGETISGGFSNPSAGSAAHSRMICGYRTLTAPESGVNPDVNWTTARRAVAAGIVLKGMTPVPVTPSYVLKMKQADGSWKNYNWKIVK